MVCFYHNVISSTCTTTTTPSYGLVDFTGDACDKPLLPSCFVHGATFDVTRWLTEWLDNNKQMDKMLGTAVRRCRLTSG